MVNIGNTISAQKCGVSLAKSGAAALLRVRQRVPGLQKAKWKCWNVTAKRNATTIKLRAAAGCARCWCFLAVSVASFTPARCCFAQNKWWLMRAMFSFLMPVTGFAGGSTNALKATISCSILARSADTPTQGFAVHTSAAFWRYSYFCALKKFSTNACQAQGKWQVCCA